MTVMLEDFPLEQKSNFAKCQFYSPESDTEGTCYGAKYKPLVSRLSGCDNPKNCLTYQERMGVKKK